MATTSRKKRQKESAIEQPKQKEVLDPGHLLVLETSFRDVANAKLAMAVEEQALKNLILELKLLEVEIEKKKLLVSQKAQKYELEKKKMENARLGIFEEYGFSKDKGLAYDSNSGKIIRDYKAQ